MKIIHIIPNLGKGGAERITIDIVRSLKRDSTNQVKLILFEDKIDYEVVDLLDVIEIIPSKVQLSMHRKNILDIANLQQTFDNFQPDIIHSHLFEAEIVSRSCFFPSARWFTHVHDRMKSFENLNFFKIRSKRDLTNYFEKQYLMKRYNVNSLNRYIAISENIETYLFAVLPVKLQEVYLLPNAIEVSRFKRPFNDLKMADEQICKLISIGRLDINKNHQFLVDVVEHLKSRNFPVLLEILGEGDQRINLESKIANLQLGKEIKLLGSLDNVQEYFWKSDIYIHSATTEGFGLTLIEAMAAGLPVITLDGGGNKKLIQEGKNGFLIEDQNVKVFSDRIIELFQNKAQYNSFSQNAINFAAQFDINPYIDKLLTIYKNSL